MTFLLHYLIINVSCQRLRDSGFRYIKSYVVITLLVYLSAVVLMVIEGLDCQGYGTKTLLGYYLSNFLVLVIAPTEQPDE